MSKDITEEILLNAGFQKGKFKVFSNKGNNPIDIYYTAIPENGRHWRCMVYLVEKITVLWADAYIQTIEQFNKLMELMDIKFRLKEE